MALSFDVFLVLFEQLNVYTIFELLSYFDLLSLIFFLCVYTLQTPVEASTQQMDDCGRVLLGVGGNDETCA